MYLSKGHQRNEGDLAVHQSVALGGRHVKGGNVVIELQLEAQSTSTGAAHHCPRHCPRHAQQTVGGHQAEDPFAGRVELPINPYRLQVHRKVAGPLHQNEGHHEELHRETRRFTGKQQHHEHAIRRNVDKNECEKNVAEHPIPLKGTDEESGVFSEETAVEDKVQPSEESPGLRQNALHLGDFHSEELREDNVHLRQENADVDQGEEGAVQQQQVHLGEEQLYEPCHKN